MDKEGYKAWMEKIGKNDRLVSNALSRAKRVENQLKILYPGFSYEKAYKKDKGESIVKLMENKGASLPDSVYLPKGSAQMYCIASAVRNYFTFLSETSKK